MDHSVGSGIVLCTKGRYLETWMQTVVRNDCTSRNARITDADPSVAKWSAVFSKLAAKDQQYPGSGVSRATFSREENSSGHRLCVNKGIGARIVRKIHLDEKIFGKSEFDSTESFVFPECCIRPTLICWRNFALLTSARTSDLSHFSRKGIPRSILQLWRKLYISGERFLKKANELGLHSIGTHSSSH